MIRLRAAVPGDVPVLVEVFVSAWRAGYPGIVPDDVIAGLDRAEDRRWLAGVLGDSTGGLRTVVAVDVGDRPLGFVRFRPSDGYIASVYVEAGAAGGGLGRALLSHALAELRAAGCEEVTLWVFAANERARRLYERAGFAPDGAERTDPRWRTQEIRLRRAARAG